MADRFGPDVVLASALPARSGRSKTRHDKINGLKIRTHLFKPGMGNVLPAYHKSLQFMLHFVYCILKKGPGFTKTQSIERRKLHGKKHTYIANFGAHYSSLKAVPSPRGNLYFTHFPSLEGG